MDENLLYNALNFHLNEDFIQAKNIYEKIPDSYINKSCIYFLLGDIAQNQFQFDKAQEYLLKARSLNCNIDFNEDFSNKIDIIMLIFMTLVEKDNIFRMENWEKALTLKPVLDSAYINTSVSYISTNDISNAHRVCNEGLAIYPDNLDLALNKGSALLRSNFIEQGWEFQEARIKIFDHHKLKFSEDLKPKYDGSQNVQNKKIYVYHVAGLGDTIYFARYLPLLADKGAKIISKPHNSLVKLFSDNYPEINFIEDNVCDEDIKLDFQLPFMSIGNAFKTSVKTIPFPHGYLKANKEKVEFYKKNYCNTEKFRIGIFWQGSSEQRAFNLEKFIPLADNKEIKLFSFQKGSGQEQLNSFAGNNEIVDLGSTFNDFFDTAAGIECMDLLIGCDTSVSNLAAALGKPVWIVLPYFSNWRWGIWSEKTVWYSSARLFRQKEPNNWDEVFQRVYQKLDEHLCNFYQLK